MSLARARQARTATREGKIEVMYALVSKIGTHALMTAEQAADMITAWEARTGKTARRLKSGVIVMTDGETFRLYPTK